MTVIHQKKMLNLHHFDFILAPFSYHDSFLNLKSSELTDHFMLLSKEQWLKELQVDVNEDVAIPYLILNHNLSLTMAKTMCRLLNFIPPQDIHPTLTSMRSMYDGLRQSGGLVDHPFSEIKYTGKRVGIYGYHQHDPELLNHLSRLNIQAEWITLPLVHSLPSVKTYSSLVDEVTAFFNRVASLLKEGVTLDSIFLLKPSEDYIDELIRQSHYFHIPIQLEIQPPFFSFPIAQAYLALLSSFSPVEALHELHGFPGEQLFALKRLIEESSPELKASILFPLYLKDLLLETTLPSLPYKHGLNVVESRILLKDDHLFILGFNQGSYPLIARDTGYLSDPIKEKLSMMTTTLDNEVMGSRLKDLLLQSPHVHVSLRTLAVDKPLLPSSLVQTLGLALIPGESLPYDKDYQDDLGQFTYLLKKEKVKKYYQHDPSLASFHHHYDNKVPIPYNPSFKGIPKKDETDFLRLSYTSINHFYQCQYKYYLSDVLKLDPKEDPYYLHLGTLTHKVFEKIKSNLAIFDQTFDEILSSMASLSAKERMIFSHLKPRILDVLQFNINHQDHMIHPSIDEEVRFQIKLDDHTQLNGTIDKVILTKDQKGHTYASLLDYKSGLESFKPKHVPFGLSLQLPIYALLMDKHLAYEGVEVIGIYIQHILSTNLSEKDIDIDGKLFRSSLKLDGIFVDDLAKLDTFDQSYQSESSRFVKGLSLKKDGTLKSSPRIYSKDQLTELKHQTWQHVLNAKEGIRLSDFTINPKAIAGKEVCETCPFQDVCYRRKQDIKHLQVEVEVDDEEEFSNGAE